jgi:hypothetical protein
MLDPTHVAIPVFILTMVAEARVLHERHHGYDLRDTASSLSCGIGNLVVKGLTRGLYWGLFGWIYEHRVANLGGANIGFTVVGAGQSVCVPPPAIR